MAPPLDIPREVRLAESRIRPYVRETWLEPAPFLCGDGAQVHCKLENLQHTGSFKPRGALNAVLALSDEEAARGVIAASSGNFGQALAFAAAFRGTTADVVAPRNSSPMKLAAMKARGARVHLCAPTLADRVRLREELRIAIGATFVSSHDHPDVIAGQGTVALELLEDVPDLDVIVAPVGGGGLIGGIAAATSELAPQTAVIGGEPAGAGDAARSKAAGKYIPEPAPESVADGLLVGLGKNTWPLVRDHVQAVLTVDDAAIIRAMRLVWDHLKVVVEPSAAVSLAAVLSPGFAGEGPFARVGVVLSGGNVDLDALPW